LIVSVRYSSKALLPLDRGPKFQLPQNLLAASPAAGSKRQQCQPSRPEQHEAEHHQADPGPFPNIVDSVYNGFQTAAEIDAAR